MSPFFARFGGINVINPFDNGQPNVVITKPLLLNSNLTWSNRDGPRRARGRHQCESVPDDYAAIDAIHNALVFTLALAGARHLPPPACP
jgi:hypothetical protein